MVVKLSEVDNYGPEPNESVKIDGPPGTGKTTKCASRVAKLVEEHDVALNDVVWVTYRRSLAEETLDKMAEWGIITEDETDDPSSGRTRWIGTAHAIANRVAGDKLSGDFVEESDKWDFYDEYYNVPYDPDSRPSRGKLSMDVLMWLRHNEVSPSQPYRAPSYSDLQQTWPNHPSMSKLAENWSEYKEENRLNDFYEILKEAYEASDSPAESPTPSVAVADEYHDVYPLMDRLLRRWLNEADTAIVAGDPRQVVNAHEGSSPQYFNRLNIQEVNLPESHRVTETHWRAAKTMLSKSHGIPDIEVSEGGSIDRGHSPQFEYDQRTKEWSVPVGERYSPGWVVDESSGTVLFLARTRKQATGIGKALQQSGIVYESQDGAGGWNQTNKRKNLYNALQKVKEVEVEEAWYGHTVEYDETFTGEEAARLIEHSTLEHLAVEDRQEADTEARRLSTLSEVEASGLTKVVTQDWWNVYSGYASVRELTRVTSDERISLAGALSRYDKTVETLMDDEYDGYDPVQVLTIHASKGYEAENVVLYDGITSKIQESIRSSKKMEANEHRTWYVGLTRARNNLIILDDAFDWTTSFLPYRLGRSNEVVHQ